MPTAVLTRPTAPDDRPGPATLPEPGPCPDRHALLRVRIVVYLPDDGRQVGLRPVRFDVEWLTEED